MLQNKNNIYFLGIGGIGMSALARYFNAKGYKVAGYDRVSSKLTVKLQQEGIDIHYEDNIMLIPESHRNPKNTLVIFTPAVPDSLSEWDYLREKGFTILKRAQALGEITRQQRAICIAGTHGKTTTSTMTAHLFYQSQVGCSAFLGGVSKNYDTNLLLSSKGANSKEEGCEEAVVIEADEYDRSFWTLTPYMAAITSVDADHLDIYGDEREYVAGFEKFTSLIREGGALVLKKGLAINPELQKGVCLFTYSAEEEADFCALNIRIGNGNIIFDFATPQGVVKDIKLGVPIKINIENAVAAMALAWLNGVTPDEIREAMSTFAGVKRRFDFQIKQDDLVFLDDYAHHPQELNACITSIKALYEEKKICGIFQPHLYTRTRDFADDFARSLSLLDEVILLDIYPAREMPIEGVTSHMLLEKINIPKKQVCTQEELETYLSENQFEIVVTIGAGDIELLVPRIKEILLRKSNG